MSRIEKMEKTQMNRRKITTRHRSTSAPKREEQIKVKIEDEQ